EQRRRFLRHARPWWDVHRHRIAPEVAATVARLVGEGRLEIMAGRIVSARENDGALEVEFRRRGAKASQTERFAYAFNCTGPLHAIEHTKDPLLRSLLDAAAIRPDQLGIGLDVDERSRANGGERIWALGPLTKGRYWEIIAVPDIREQAAAVADDIERELGA
ncbi:MAG TPA: FAD-dependent oxidoreductase, partial [Sphingomicrobium sp.]